MNGSSQTLIPIGLLMAEGFDTVTATRRFADQLVINDAGLRCLPASTVRSLIDKRDQRRAAERERLAAEREAAWRRPHPVQERVRAIAAAQKHAGGPNGPLAPYAGGLR